MGTPLCFLTPRPPPLLPSTLIALYFISSSRHHSHKCSLSLFPFSSSDIHPLIPEAKMLAEAEAFLTTTYDNRKCQTTFCVIPAPRYFTSQQCAHLSDHIEDILCVLKHTVLLKGALYIYSSITQMKTVWCDVMRLPVWVHYSSVQTRP